MDEQCWIYEGECLKQQIEGVYGYVYLIVDDTGRKYIGKKAFQHRTKKKIPKRTRLKQKTRARIRISYEDSKWLQYWSSCKPLLEYIKQKGNTLGFKRTILKLCPDRASLAYWETVYLIKHEVLFDNNYWNGNVAGKFFKGKIKK